ncbi:MAG: hydantoinase B/oxoprolinase family protein, partial [Candidatus Tectomicrobia bacterium]|nr:hydantoinase B/oxoprolinase family protein [Candidatus Tectomicrobia bacterium]
MQLGIIHTMYTIGIDVGGTFTDFVVVKDGEEPRYFKTPSTPGDPSQGVMRGLQEIAFAYSRPLDELVRQTRLILHGTTVATNTLVERKGAKVGLITTKGFRDLLEIREGLKEDRYNLRMSPVEPLVPRYLRLGIPERVDWNGEVVTPLDEKALEEALRFFSDEGVEALAVCFLFSYLNSKHEEEVAEKIRCDFPHFSVSLSHQVLPQIKEFERLSTTVVNAYVGPMFGSYLARLQARFADLGQPTEILIMQSNGGVAPIDDSMRFAVRAILSGPAGGVSGAALYSQLLGQENVIGFDMGGTSTDISLIEHGEPHLTAEKFEGGWKIAVPMIDIQTLGAGGGSIARVDSGGILKVGPQSAGADPGPACYGKGGTQPTVTDADLVLGYLDPENFLGGKAKLQKEVAEKAIIEHIATPLRLSLEEAAYGIYRVVCNNMAEGIRLASVKKGVDPREFSILAFGGASGLHVSRVARQLQIKKILIPAAAPVLSAYGMLSTDLRYDFSQSYTVSLQHLDLEKVKAIYKEMESKGIARLREEGIPEESIEIRRSADMRYLDQLYEVTVPLPGLGKESDLLLKEWADNFHRRYEELYSYSQVDQEIRLTTLRTSVIGQLPKTALPEKKLSQALPEKTSKGKRTIYVGSWQEAEVYDFDLLSPGQEIHGPAIIESSFTTILLERGDIASVDRYGGLEITVSLAMTEEESPSEEKRSDPITLSVIQHRLESIAQEMGEVMIRTSMSQILNSSRDFSTAILDSKGQLSAQGEHIPVHISALPPAVIAVQNYFKDDIHEGDLFAVNDPYFGGSHLPDITVIYPIFHEGKVLFYAVNRAHHSDIGGGTHGGYNPRASEIYHEGIRIPPIKLHERGIPRRDLLHMLAVNVRHSENFLGDLNAQIGSVMIAAQRLKGLIAHYSADRLTSVVADILDATERRVRKEIASWPDGVYFGETFLDDDGFESSMIPIRAKVTIQGETMTIDLSESSPQVTGFINSAYANTRSLAHVAIMYLASPDTPKNEGSMRSIRVIAPEGLIVNPRPPAPVCMSTNHCGEEIIEAVFKALAPAVPKLVTAGFSRRLRFAITGRDPRTNRRFIWHLFHARGGGGASYEHDGWPCVGEINVAGAIRSPSVEITEER